MKEEGGWFWIAKTGKGFFSLGFLSSGQNNFPENKRQNNFKDL